MKDFVIFSINPGSTSTKISAFHGDEKIFIKNVKHELISDYRQPFGEGVKFYKELILKELSTFPDFKISQVDAFVGRGGGLIPCKSGTYEINDIMIKNTHDRILVFLHPAAYAPQIAYEFAKENGKKAYTVN